MNETDLNNQTQKEQSQKEQRQQKLEKDTKLKERESMFILILINQITQSKRY